MKRHVYVVVGLALLGFAAPPKGTAEDAKDELEGNWLMVSFERDGKETKPMKVTRLVNTGGKFIVKSGDDVVVAGTYKVDVAKKPKAIDVTYTDGPDKGKTFKGIYQIDGDIARFCRPAKPEQDRPAEFKTSEEKPATLMVYKREKR